MKVRVKSPQDHQNKADLFSQVLSLGAPFSGTGASFSGNANAFTRSSIKDQVELSDVCAKFPKLATAKFYDTILCPGDALYIPHLAWHYVRSLTTSVSVNFWYNY